jgi:hypothetical protein
MHDRLLNCACSSKNPVKLDLNLNPQHAKSHTRLKFAPASIIKQILHSSADLQAFLFLCARSASSRSRTTGSKALKCAHDNPKSHGNHSAPNPERIKPLHCRLYQMINPSVWSLSGKFQPSSDSKKYAYNVHCSLQHEYTPGWQVLVGDFCE